MAPNVLIALLLLQAKSRGLSPSECQALSDIADVSKALERQREMLGQFQELTYPNLDTWVVVRVTDNTPQAQSAATTPAAADSTVASTTVVQSSVEHGASAVTPSSDAVGAPPADSVQNRASSVSKTQAEAGKASQIPQGGNKPSQQVQVRPVGLLSMETTVVLHSTLALYACVLLRCS